ncbi:MAG: RNA recognition motif domain-containing protein [Chthoniobacterales bacterium]
MQSGFGHEPSCGDSNPITGIRGEDSTCKTNTKIMGSKLYVGNLSFNTTESDLKSLFAAAGTVSEASLVTDRESGNSRGFGFVTMSSDAEAQAAISQFSGKDVDGRSLTVNEARPREEGGGGRKFGGGGGNRGGGRDGGGRGRY